MLDHSAEVVISRKPVLAPFSVNAQSYSSVCHTCASRPPVLPSYEPRSLLPAVVATLYMPAAVQRDVGAGVQHPGVKGSAIGGKPISKLL